MSTSCLKWLELLRKLSHYHISENTMFSFGWNSTQYHMSTWLPWLHVCRYYSIFCSTLNSSLQRKQRNTTTNPIAAYERGSQPRRTYPYERVTVVDFDTHSTLILMIMNVVASFLLYLTLLTHSLSVSTDSVTSALPCDLDPSEEVSHELSDRCWTSSRHFYRSKLPVVKNIPWIGHDRRQSPACWCLEILCDSTICKFIRLLSNHRLIVHDNEFKNHQI